MMPLSSLNIRELTEFIHKNEGISDVLSREQQAKLAKARLKLACWVCKREELEPDLTTLSSIIGEHFASVVPYIKDVKEELGDEGPITP